MAPHLPFITDTYRAYQPTCNARSALRSSWQGQNDHAVHGGGAPTDTVILELVPGGGLGPVSVVQDRILVWLRGGGRVDLSVVESARYRNGAAYG